MLIYGCVVQTTSTVYLMFGNNVCVFDPIGVSLRAALTDMGNEQLFRVQAGHHIVDSLPT